MYQYLRFRSDRDGSEAHLPRALADDKLTTGDLIAPYVDTIGGVGAWRTDDIADVTQRRIQLTGSYVGRDGPLRLADDILLDDTDPLSSGDAEGAVATLWQGLAALRGHQGRLYRQWVGADDEQWALATLVRAESNLKPEGWIARKIDVRSEFILPGGAWIGDAHSETITVGSGEQFKRPTITNDGNTVSDTLVITLTPSSTQALSTIQFAYGNVEWIWSGPTTSGQALVINTADQTILETTSLGPISRIDDLEVTAAHRAATWAPLDPGRRQVGFILNNCEGDLDLEWRDTFI